MIVALSLFPDYLVRLEREDGLPRIVMPQFRDRRGARHRLRRGGLFALRIGSGSTSHARSLRFAYSSMTTPAEIYDYDLVTRERASCASARKSPQAMIRPTMSRAGFSPRRPMATRCRSRSFTASDLAPRRQRAARCSTAMAPMAIRCRRRSAQRASRWSIAASSMRSPICAAARTRAGAGTSTASSPTSRTHSPISSPRRAHLIAAGYHRRRAHRRRTAAAPAAC